MLDFSKNYFELFGLPVTYVIDADALRERYRDLQRVVHPDRFTKGSDQERRLSMQGATHINEAFETLRDPLRRAQYLLRYYGVEMDAGHETTKDTAFLMEQMELREELATLRNGEDPLSKVQAFMARIGRMINQTISQMVVDFETPDAERLAAVREKVRQMQFLNKLHAEAEALEARIEEEVY